MRQAFQDENVDFGRMTPDEVYEYIRSLPEEIGYNGPTPRFIKWRSYGSGGSVELASDNEAREIVRNVLKYYKEMEVSRTPVKILIRPSGNHFFEFREEIARYAVWNNLRKYEGEVEKSGPIVKAMEFTIESGTFHGIGVKDIPQKFTPNWEFWDNQSRIVIYRACPNLARYIEFGSIASMQDKIKAAVSAYKSGGMKGDRPKATQRFVEEFRRTIDEHGAEELYREFQNVKSKWHLYKLIMRVQDTLSKDNAHWDLDFFEEAKKIVEIESVQRD